MLPITSVTDAFVPRVLPGDKVPLQHYPGIDGGLSAHPQASPLPIVCACATEDFGQPR